MNLFVQLDTAWPDNPKIIQVGLEGAGLHAIAMCIAKPEEGREYLARLVPEQLSSPLTLRAVEWLKGHLDSPTEGLDPAPFSTTPDVVGAAIARAVGDEGVHTVWVPTVLGPLMAVMRVMPRSLWRRIAGDR